MSVAPPQAAAVGEVLTQQLSYLEKSGAALGQTLELIDTEEKTREKVAAAVGPLAKELVKLDLLPAHFEKKGAEALMDHPKALELLGEVLVEYRKLASRTKQAAAGVAEPPPGAAVREYNSLADNYVGRRIAPGIKESEKSLLRLAPNVRPDIAR